MKTILPRLGRFVKRPGIDSRKGREPGREALVVA
jgi:hypothetical protein